jgi:hypothetical protein
VPCLWIGVLVLFKRPWFSLSVTFLVVGRALVLWFPGACLLFGGLGLCHVLRGEVLILAVLVSIVVVMRLSRSTLVEVYIPGVTLPW